MSAPRRRTTVALAALTLGGAVLIGQAGASPLSGPTTAATDTSMITSAEAVAAAPAVTLSDEVKADLAFSRDEERLARDLYQTLAAKYGSTTVFANIAKSEQRHFEAIGTLLNRYGLADPAAGKPAGQYANADLQKLYDGWKARGLQSEANAFQVGIELEKRDIADLQRMTTRTTITDINRVYTRLLAASRQHLAAFTAASQGKSLCPACTAQGGRGAGPGNGRGAGPGQGQGRGPGQGQGPGQGAGMGRGQGMGRGRTAGPGTGPGSPAQATGAGPTGWSPTA